MTTPDPASNDPEVILESLRRSVHKALDRKEKLQQYSVTWVNNAPYYDGPDAPVESESQVTRASESGTSYRGDDSTDHQVDDEV